MKTIDTVLIATDLSDPSVPAVDAGADLAEKYGAKIIMGYVVEDHLPPLGIVEYSGVSFEAITEQHRQRAQERLQVYAKDCTERGLEVSIDVAQGVPHAEIVDMAKRHNADMIVMSTHGRGFISHAIIGSTTERVLRHAPCPVLVVRDPRR